MFVAYLFIFKNLILFALGYQQDLQFEPCFVHVKYYLRAKQIKMIYPQNKMTVKVAERLQWQKINVTESTLYMESYMLYNFHSIPFDHYIVESRNYYTAMQVILHLWYDHYTLVCA